MPQDLLFFFLTAVGEKVYARWTNYVYYPGQVKNIGQDDVISVLFDDGGARSYYVTDNNGVILDVAPSADSVTLHTRVIAVWPANGKYYSATVTKIDEGGRYNVEYDDGGKGPVDLSQMRLLPWWAFSLIYQCLWVFVVVPVS